MPGPSSNGDPTAENTITVAGVPYLLVDAGSLRAHLAARHEDPVLEWQSTTVCGRTWQDVLTEADEVWAPDCRTCLRIVDMRLPAQRPDERTSTLAQLVTAAVVEHGSAEVLGVPGDQLTGFRTAVRAALKARGFRSKTFVEGELLLVMSDDARQAMSEDARHRQQRMLAQAIQNIGLGHGGPPIDTSGWKFRWSDWTCWR